jgi:hypothetical protein
MRRAVVAVAGTIGLVIVTGLSAYAVAAPKGPTKRALSQTLTGATISANESALKVVSSLDGTGAALQHVSVTGKTFPLSGKLTETIYFADGVAKAKGTFKLSALDANAISTITGSGKCVSGTRVHKAEKCTFTFTGTYNSKTTITKVKVIGTDTR